MMAQAPLQPPFEAQHARLRASRVLREQAEDILRGWESRIRARMPEKLAGQNRLELRSHFPQFLIETARVLAGDTPGTGDFQPLPSAARAKASRVHAQSRFARQGYREQDLVVEYGILRECILEELEAAGALDLKTAERVDAVIDEGINESIRTFASLLKTEADQFREEFITIASHEFRTPITSLLLNFQYLSRAIRKLDLPEDRKQIIHQRFESCIHDLRRISQLVHLIMDTSKLRLENLPLLETRFDLSRIVRDVVQREQAELADARTPVRMNLHPGLAIRGDPERIEQVVRALLSNAVKFGRGKPLDIELRELPGSKPKVQLVIRDRGVGIPDELQSRIFQRFVTGDGASKTGGLGLSLYVCRKIVESHQGSIEVQSKPGQGATFTLTFPRA